MTKWIQVEEYTWIMDVPGGIIVRYVNISGHSSMVFVPMKGIGMQKEMWLKENQIT